MFLTRAEVAERLDVSERTVDRYIRRGLLTAIKTPGAPNGTIRISKESFDQYVQANELQSEDT